MNVDERTTANLAPLDDLEAWIEPEYWLEADIGVLVGYATETSKPMPVAVLIYQPVSTKTIRSLDLLEYRKPGSTWLRFDGPQPPSFQTVLEARGKRRRALVARLKKGRQKDDRKARERARQALIRIEGEPPDSFYERVASAYQLLEKRFGTPVKEISELAEVPHSTAARWVRQCRIRPIDSETKFLPPAKEL